MVFAIFFTYLLKTVYKKMQNYGQFSKTAGPHSYWFHFIKINKFRFIFINLHVQAHNATLTAVNDDFMSVHLQNKIEARSKWNISR